MTTLGTALTPNAIKVMMLGSGELGKEVVIELQRLGVEVIAVDRYENAPAQQVGASCLYDFHARWCSTQSLSGKRAPRLHCAGSGSHRD